MTGEQVRRIRTRLGLTQAAFGKLVGVTGNTIARWERNEVRITDPMAKLLKLLTTKEAK